MKSFPPRSGTHRFCPHVSGSTADVRLQYQLNTLDNPVIPRSGESLLLLHQGLRHQSSGSGSVSSFQRSNRKAFSV